jgi:SAM-dependent methyltransferase
MDLHLFIAMHLPPPPARVLEVGCGRGELAQAVASSGHRVVAIDPNAPAGELFQPVTLEEFEDTEPFDAVIASRSLHHIPDLAGALDKIARLLRPGSRLIVNEHAFDRFDGATARWYLAQRAAISTSSPPSLKQCMAEWEADHAGLHGYAAMRTEIDSRFTESYFTWRPYLYEELGPPVAEAEEQSLIDAGTIQATGFRYVGERN